MLFSDMAGFTALTETSDPEDVRQIMGDVFGCASEIVARYGGQIEKFIGDAVMAIFGVPTSHEDDPVRAVRAAVELHEAVAILGQSIKQRTGLDVAMHSGINTGVVVTGELRFDRGVAGPLGDTINTAARLMSAAPAGEIWIGAETQRVVAPLFEVEDLGPQSFKGKANAVHASRVLRLRSRSAALNHHRGAFVGRQAQLATLLSAAEGMRDGVASKFGVRGDAGSGKTRLLSEFRSRLGRDVQWLEGRAYPFAQQMAYSPVIDLFSRLWRLDEADGPTELRAALRRAVASLPGNAPGVLPLLYHLFNLPQDAGTVVEREVFQERLLQAIRQMLAAMRLGGPVVVCLQDLHWADPSTLTLWNGLCTEAGAPVMLLGNYRPEYTAGVATQEIELGELSAVQTGELLASLLGNDPPADLAHLISERSDGNPFYVEEVVNSLIESKWLVRTADGWTLARPLSEASIPSTIRAVIAARIDRLEESHRRVLRYAAVVGREFMQSTLARLVDDGGSLASALNHLRDADLIRERKADPEREFAFKHALTQDVAYEGLLKSERRALHAKTALAIEELFESRIPEFIETLAYHFDRGGEDTKAVHYLVEAGRKSVARYALAEANAHLARAYELITSDTLSPERCRALVDLLTTWSQVWYYEGRIGEWRQRLEHHVADAERCADPGSQALFMGWLGNARSFHGDLLGAAEALDRALALGRPARADDAVAHATAWRIFVGCDLGRIDEAIELANSLILSDEDIRQSPYPFLKSQGGLALALAWRGDFGRSREVAARLIQVGHTTGNARTLSIGHFGLALQWILVLDFEQAAATAAMGLSAARDPLFSAANALVRSLALAMSLKADEARRVCDDWLPFLERNENIWFGLLMQQVRSSTDLARGELTPGFQSLLEGPGKCRGHQMHVIASLAEVLLALTYVTIARRDVKPTVGALLRNPRFVLLQAPFAAGRAKQLIGRLRDELQAKRFDGMLGLVDLAEARLLAHQKRGAEAFEIVERIRRRLAQACLDESPPPLQALVAEIVVK